MTRILILGLLFAVQPTLVVHAQTALSEAGKPYFVQRYSPQEYGLNEQNWGVAQDARGVIFVANRTGVLEYDGTEWRAHPIPNQFARSLAVSSDGSVCIGGVGEIGCLRPDSMGGLAYNSLTDQLDADLRDFGDVWTTHAVSGSVLFQSARRVIRWDGSSLTTFEATDRFHKAFAAHGRYFVRDEGVGLLELTASGLTLVAGGEAFAEERIDVLLPVGESDLLIVTRTAGIQIWREGALRRVSGVLESRLDGLRVYAGASLDERRFALTTTTGTVVIGDVSGRILFVLADNVGLEAHEIVTDAMRDQQGGLWLTLDTGIMRVDAPTQLTTFDQSLGLEGVVYDVRRYRGDVYVSTTQGLYRLSSSATGMANGSVRFERVAQLSQQIWQTLETSTSLLIATNDGVYELVGDDEVYKVLDERAFAFTPSLLEPDVIFVALKDGVGTLREMGGRWQPESLLGRGEIIDARSIREDVDGAIWIGTLSDGVIRLNSVYDNNEDHVQIHAAEGVPTGVGSVIMGLNEEIMILSQDGIYRRSHPESLRFVRDNRFDDIVRFGSSSGYLLSFPDQHHVWVIDDDGIARYQYQGGRLIEVTPSVINLSGIPVRLLGIDEFGTVWIATEDGLLRYDPSVEKDYAVAFPALVRSVSTKGDRVLFGGFAASWQAQTEVRYDSNNLRFTVSASSYNQPEANHYQFWLEGFDEGWSDWTFDPYKEYTNLPEGRYRFHVRARNVHGQLSEVDTYSFVVLPPWYRTWWAYSLYVIFALIVLWSYGRWRLREHLKEMERERRVRESLEVANARLRQANERLHRADRLKDDLLANTSHELRTPLTSILGFAGVLKEELDGEQGEFASHIERSGQRLLSTVNALLDMARLQAESLDFERETFDAMAVVREVAGAHRHVAEAKGLFLTVQPQGLSVTQTSDRKAVFRVLENLIGNAVKFTERGGVTVLVDADDSDIHFTIKDTGIGIREEFLPHLFSEFQQASTGYARSFEGTGLGLAIAHRLVKLLGGRISVESTEGEGASFIVSLPKGEPSESAKPRPPKEFTRRISTLCLGLEDTPGDEVLTAAGMISTRLDVAVGLDEARRCLARSRHDLVIIDAGGIQDDVLETLRALRVEESLSHASFVLVSSIGMPGERERWVSAGFDDYIARPVTVDRMLVTLEAAVRPVQSADHR